MTPGAATASGRSWTAVAPAWAITVAMMAATLVVGAVSASLARPLFVIGCLAVAHLAWRESPASHLRVLILLFVFAPFLRRITDLGAGYDPLGLMLVGPLFALALPGLRLMTYDNLRELTSERFGPILVVGVTVLWATLLSMVAGAWNDTASGLLKWGAPLIYAATLLVEDVDRDEMLSAAASAFFFVLPVVGIYGILQFVDPPAWDRYWLQYASIMSAGRPEPFAVRVFSTLNGPASCATFLATGLLLVGFLKRGWWLLPVALPAVIALLLTTYRTAWISLAGAIVYATLFAPTRLRAVGIILVAVVGGMVALMASPEVADTLSVRLATFGSVGQDVSALERLEQFVLLWSRAEDHLIGGGFATVDVGAAGTMAIDGMLIACWTMMGLVGGLVCLSGFLWAILRALPLPSAGLSRGRIVTGGLMVGALVQLPLANIGAAELGFLFWTFATLAVCRGAPEAVA